MTDSNHPSQPERAAPPPQEQRPGHDVHIEEHGVDLLTLAVGAGIYKAVDMGADYVSAKIADARRPADPPPADPPAATAPPRAEHE